MAAVLTRLAEAQLGLEEAQKRHEEEARITDLKMRETTEKLDALIRIVDDQIRNRPRPEA